MAAVARYKENFTLAGVDRMITRVYSEVASPVRTFLDSQWVRYATIAMSVLHNTGQQVLTSRSLSYLQGMNVVLLVFESLKALKAGKDDMGGNRLSQAVAGIGLFALQIFATSIASMPVYLSATLALTLYATLSFSPSYSSGLA